MHKFYFNDCLPICSNQHEFINCLEKTLREFKKLTDEGINIEKAIITEKLPSTMLLGNHYSLGDSINKISDNTLKRLAFYYFQKYPIDAYFSLEGDVIDRLLTLNYGINIDKSSLIALNLAMVHQNNGFIFTTALHDDLKQHLLCLKPNLTLKVEEPNLEIHNLFGEEENTRIIREKIVSLNNLNLSNIENLKQVLGDFIFSSKFERDFLGLNDAEQTSIIDDFEKAKKRKLLSPFYPDTKIIKDVTPDKPKCNVYELRVYTPTVLRVYFNEYKDKVYVASIGFKGSTKQSEDIKNAHTALNKMILTA